LDSKKKGTFGDIPTKCLKEASNECTHSLADIWNHEIIRYGHFPNELKLADVTPVFKKKQGMDYQWIPDNF